MFGMGITEILLIAVIAIIFLGPEHLPKAMIEVAKFIKSVKKVVTETKETIEKEVNIHDLKNEALEYKKMVESGVGELTKIGDLDFEGESKPVSEKDTKLQTQAQNSAQLTKEIPKIEGQA